ncbi:MAG: M67 family metallopeptidase [Myxococcota bacterium]
MSRRIDVDGEIAPLAIPGRVLNELYAHALETLPEECCGLIIGDDEVRFSHVVRCRNEMTQLHHADPASFPRDGRRAFHMNPSEYQRVLERVDSSGERVTAVYHSHVDTGAYLSELDLEYAEHPLFPFPEAAQIVLAVLSGKVHELGLFERDALPRGFRGRGVQWGGP